MVVLLAPCVGASCRLSTRSLSQYYIVKAPLCSDNPLAHSLCYVVDIDKAAHICNHFSAERDGVVTLYRDAPLPSISRSSDAIGVRCYTPIGNVVFVGALQKDGVLRAILYVARSGAFAGGPLQSLADRR